MFRLFRYYSLASAAAILAVTVALVVLYRQNAIDELVVTAESQNVFLGRSFANTVWPEFSAYITSVAGDTGDALRARPETLEIDAALTAIMAGLPVLKVKIYNLDGLTVYSSEPEQMGVVKSNNLGFLASARDGKPASELSFRDTFSAFSGIVENRDLVESYIPIRGADGNIEGVFELYTDVTPLMGRIDHAANKLTAGLLLIFGLLYGGLSLIVRYADRILKRQYAELTRSKETIEAHSVALEKRFKAVVDNSPAKIHIKDAEGRYILINRQAETLLGVTDEEALGRTTQEILPENLSNALLTHDQMVLESGHAVEQEEEWRRDGRTITYLTVKFPIFDADGAIVAVGAVGTDITERKQAEKELRLAKEHAELANRTKTEFLANMSHELRTPLNAIIGFSDMITGEMFGPVGNPKYLDYANDINSSGVHLLEIINDILDLSAIEAGTVDLHEENVDVPRVLRSCVALVRERAHEGGVTIDSDIAEGLPALYADERKLKQILLNLMSNAVKFTRPGGKVALRAWSRAGDGYVFQVADTGIGIALKDIPKVLDAFKQVDSGLNREFEGTGLGLPLSKALAELHGASLDLQSERGVGTTVTVRFPAERIVPETAAETAAE